MLLASCGEDAPSGNNTGDKKQDNNIITLTQEQYKNAGIETAQLSLQNISSHITVNGKIEVPPQNIISVSVPLGGYIKSTKLIPGMRIKKGEVLAEIEDQQYIQLQQEYLTAKAQFAFSQAEYNRQKELNASKAASDKVFEQVRVQYQTQSVTLRSLEEKLKLIGLAPSRVTVEHLSKSIRIYAPVNGFVSAVYVNTGKFVNPSDILFELIDPGDMHLALTVFEKDISRLYAGQKLVAYSNSNPGKKYPCTVILINKSITGNNSTLVHCHFDKPDQSLLPGMFMNAEIKSPVNNVRALPDHAIVRFQSKTFAFIAKDQNTFEMREIKTGASENGYTEVLNSKEEHSRFVVKGAYHLLMALKNIKDE